MSPASPRETQSTVLVVEDDPVLNRLLVRQLAKAGHAVGSAHSWAEARQKLPTLEPDLVLLDKNCRTLPASRPWPKSPPAFPWSC